jgi:hypothetical protein
MCDLMPASGALPGVGDCDIDAFLTKLRAETTALTWIGLCLGALLWLLTPVVTLGVPLPALLLGANARDRHILALTSTRIYLLRQAVFLLKMYASMCWGQHPSVRSHFNLAAYPVDPGTFRTT